MVSGLEQLDLLLAEIRGLGKIIRDGGYLNFFLGTFDETYLSREDHTELATLPIKIKSPKQAFIQCLRIQSYATMLQSAVKCG